MESGVPAEAMQSPIQRGSGGVVVPGAHDQYRAWRVPGDVLGYAAEQHATQCGVGGVPDHDQVDVLVLGDPHDFVRRVAGHGDNLNGYPPLGGRGVHLATQPPSFRGVQQPLLVDLADGRAEAGQVMLHDHHRQPATGSRAKLERGRQRLPGSG